MIEIGTDRAKSKLVLEFSIACVAIAVRKHCLHQWGAVESRACHFCNNKDQRVEVLVIRTAKKKGTMMLTGNRGNEFL